MRESDSGEYGAAYSLPHDMGSQSTNGIKLGMDFSYGKSVNAVSVGAGVYGTDTAGITIMGHGRNFIELSLAEKRVGYHHSESGIAGEEILSSAAAGTEQLCLAVKESMMLCVDHTGNLAAGVRVENVAQGIDGYQRSDLDLTNFYGKTSQT